MLEKLEQVDSYKFFKWVSPILLHITSFCIPNW